ncbi:proteasome assembly chaperone 2 [Elysia marginata]|uniref:Proteasome assembly chaperone 2 n=1 Tax=Elysia marginata TaxID=1093978 RepID=A0AAV4G2Y0_9GAST|nr:proteasome assembly chaperone 2 [Elysia marginata]
MFVSEGDNAADGLAIADQLNQWLNLITIQKETNKELQSKNVAAGIMKWKIPMSWRLVFGSKFDQKLFQ